MLPSAGKFEFDDGGSYCGGWSDGKAHGHGVCSGPQGQGHYAGSWNHGFETSGTYTWPSGNLYAGDWNSGKRHGLGEEVKGRWIYRGEWTHGFKGRYGVRQSVSSGACYAGTWTTGLQDGYGVEVYVDGGTYRGQWLQSMRHGFGIRQSSVYGLAVRYRHKTTSSKSSMMTSSSDHEDGATTRRRDEKIDNERGGFVLLGRVEHRTAVEGNTEGRLRRTLARLKKQRSTSDLSPGSHTGLSRMSPGPSRHRTPDRLARSQRASSEELDDHNESIHTDSCNASFISQDEMRVGASGDINVVETYSGEWKNDKRSGYGVCERTDGLKYEGEWFNNKKNGYGLTTFQDGTLEEGKYKENELVLPLTIEKSSSNMFAMKQSKLRDNINSAVQQALHASQIAHQKTDIATARQANAKLKSELAVTTANKARADAELARQMAAQCEDTPLQLEMLQTMVNNGGKVPADSAGSDDKRDHVTTGGGGERRQSRSLSIFARAFGKGNDSRRPSTVAAVFQAATSTLRQTPARWSRRTSSITADNINSQMRKQPPANSVTWKESRDRLSSESPDRDFMRSDVTRQREWSSNHVSPVSHVTQRRADDFRDQDRRNHISSSNSSQILDRNPDIDKMNYNANYRNEEQTVRRRFDDADDVQPQQFQQFQQLQQQQQFVSSYDSREHQEDIDIDSEERDYFAPTLSNANRQKPRSSSRGPVKQSADCPPQSVARRLTLPSIVKYDDQNTPSDTGNTAPNKQTPDTYVIINGERRRVAMATDVNDTSLRSHSQLSSATDSGPAPQTALNSLPHEDLPSRYSLVPMSAAGGRTARSRNRGSLPDVSTPSPASSAGFMSREEVHFLSQKRREELRVLREEEEKRRKFQIVLSLGTLQEWSSQRQLLIFVVAINVSLAAVFWNLLRHS